MKKIEACDPEDIRGYAFTYGHSRKVSSSTPVDWNFLNEKTGAVNRGPGEYAMVVRCRDCGALMEYRFGPNEEDLGGRYVCPLCGIGVRELTLYNQLERENDDF